MDNPTQQQIDAIIQRIYDAEEPNTVSNIMVAVVFAYLADKVKIMSTTSELNNEATARQNADAMLDERITALQTSLNTLMNGNVTDAIESFNEVISFLAEVTDDETLTGLLNQINTRLANAEDGMDAKADLNPHTSKIPYAQMPDVVLASMGVSLDNVNNGNGVPVTYHPSAGSTYWDENTKKIIFVDNTGTPRDMGSPRPGLIYCNKMSNLTYRWTGIDGWRQVGGGPGDGSGDGDGGLTAAFVGNALVLVNAATSELIQLSRSSIDFGECEQNGQKSVTFTIKGKNLTEDVSIVLSDVSGAFSVLPASINAADANTTNTVTVTYSPVSIGTHSATITLRSGGATNTVELQGTAVEQVVPTININDGQDVAIAAASGETATKRFMVVGRNLTPNTSATVAVTAGIGITASPLSFSTDSNGNFDQELELTYTAGVTNVSGTLTVTCGETTASVDLAGAVQARLAAGSYWVDGFIKYTVLADTSKVSAEQPGSQNLNAKLTIPAMVTDAGKTVYDSENNIITPSGMSYRVYSIPEAGFRNTAATAGIEFEDGGVTSIGKNAFNSHGLSVSGEVIVLPDSLSWIGQYGFLKRKVTKLVVKSNISGDGTPFTGDSGSAYFRRLEITSNVTSINWTTLKPQGSPAGVTPIVVCRASTPPNTSGAFQDTLSGAILYVPDDKISAYQQAAGWGENFNTINGLSDLIE